MTAVGRQRREADRRRPRGRLRRPVAQGRFAAPADPRRPQPDRAAARDASCAPRPPWEPRRCRLMLRPRRDSPSLASAGGRVRVPRPQPEPPRRAPGTTSRPTGWAPTRRRSVRRTAARRRARDVRRGRQLLVRAAARRDRRAGGDARRAGRAALPDRRRQPRHRLWTRGCRRRCAWSPTSSAPPAATAGGDAVPDRPPVVAARRRMARHAGPRRSRPPGSASYGDVLGELAAVGAVTGAQAAGRRQRAVVAGRRPRSLAAAGRTHARHLRAASWSTRPTGTTTATPALRARRRGGDLGLLQPARGVGARRRRRRWRPAGGGSGARSRPGASDARGRCIFTELGYRSRAGATAAPWDESAGGTPDLEEQRRAFAAFRRVWTGRPDPRRRLRLELVRLRRPGHHQLHPARQARRERRSAPCSARCSSIYFVGPMPAAIIVPTETNAVTGMV